VSDDRLATVRTAVIRAWYEAGTGSRLRIRITFADATTGGQIRSTVVSTTDEACAVLRDWLTTGRGKAP